MDYCVDAIGDVNDRIDLFPSKTFAGNCELAVGGLEAQGTGGVEGMVARLLIDALRGFRQHLALAGLVKGLEFAVRDQIAPAWLRLRLRAGKQRFQLLLVWWRIVSPGSKLEILDHDSLLRFCKPSR